jgi:Rrf2 family protein
MKVSRKTDYALRALVSLALRPEGTRQSIRQLAEENDIPRRFLEQIMIDLRQRGWVKAVPGRDGGYALALPAETLSLGQIVRHFDGVLAPVGCVSVTQYEPCSQERTCRFRRVFLDVRNHAARMLDRLSLADLCRSQPVDGADVGLTKFGPGEGI